jgi:hypothetical protein
MPLDAQMTRTRDGLAKHEMAPPPGLESVLPLRDGRPGKCFEDAEQIVLGADPDSGLVLVHGKCRAPGGGQADHAWIEVPGGLVYDAVLGRVYLWETYQRTVQAVPNKRYSTSQVVALANTTDNHGPWTPEEEQRAFTSG